MPFQAYLKRSFAEAGLTEMFGENTKKLEDYINYNRLVPDLLLQNTTPGHIIKTIKNFKPKNSSDAQGVSTKMIKYIGNEIAIPLAHIFNLSLSTGVFPSKLESCLYLKQVTTWSVTIIDPFSF